MTALASGRVAGHRRGGFTLVELLIALLVFSVAGFAVSSRVNDIVSQTFMLERRAVAHWVGENQVARLRAAQELATEPLSTGTRRERIYMSERDWQVVYDIKATDHPSLQRVEVEVFELEPDGGTIGPIDSFIAFVGRY